MKKLARAAALIGGAFVLTTMLAGCAKEAESTVTVGRDFSVAKLFTYEGCTGFWMQATTAISRTAVEKWHGKKAAAKVALET